PISYWVKNLMEADKRYPKPHSIPWNPMVDASGWTSRVPLWRGEQRTSPVIGRHGRDAYTKWPMSLHALKAAYCVEAPVKVRLLGGATHAVDRLGRVPSNWEILPFDGVSVREFLCGLDFYIHYPHELYIEEFGRAVMEAMALGIPVILPDQFRSTFGEAALYAAPEAVIDTIMRIWSSREAYMRRAEAGRKF